MTTGTSPDYGDATGHGNIRPVIVPEEYNWLNLYIVTRSDYTIATHPVLLVMGLMPKPSGAEVDRFYPSDDDVNFPALPDDKFWVPLTPGFVQGTDPVTTPLFTAVATPVLEYGDNNDMQVSALVARIYLQGAKQVIVGVHTAISLTGGSTTTDATDHACLIGQFSG